MVTMPPDRLTPKFELLSQEYVLVPAWKKAHDYIRRHNWYSDVLELDYTNADLAETINRISDELRSGKPLLSDPLRLVLAPKSQSWHIDSKDQWQPQPAKGAKSQPSKLRPLAHVTVRDQIISTAFMMLLADLAETRQGDPRSTISTSQTQGVASYGNRLFCDKEGTQLHFRWGNSGVYRQYFQDYQSFIARPQSIVQKNFDDGNHNWAIVSVDLSQFYDRVRPETLYSKVASLAATRADDAFLAAFKTFFNWTWDGSDKAAASRYAAAADPAIAEFDSIALPQGLVASGFFANILLLDFDRMISTCIDNWDQGQNWFLLDYCRYVDDMRFVVSLSEKAFSTDTRELESQIKDRFSSWITEVLNATTSGIITNPKKCEVVLGKNTSSGAIRTSLSMKRVNRNASGVMDLFLGAETLEIIEALLYSSDSDAGELSDRFHGTILAAKHDVRSETVARFAANKFRSVFRALRPMSEGRDVGESQQGSVAVEASDSDESEVHGTSTLTRELLDQRSFYFSRRLIERWIRDPSNMRLLRVALDLRPDSKTLELIISFIEPHVFNGNRTKDSFAVAAYCAAELFKAGATETGLVNDNAKLPTDANLEEYHVCLCKFAERVVATTRTLPWYLRDQAVLFLISFGADLKVLLGAKAVIQHRYRSLVELLVDDASTLPILEVVRLTRIVANLRGDKLAATKFLFRWRIESSVTQHSMLQSILKEDWLIAEAFWEQLAESEREVWSRLFKAFGMDVDNKIKALSDVEGKTISLRSISTLRGNPFEQEYLAIQLALKLIPWLIGRASRVSPNQVLINCDSWDRLNPSKHLEANDSFSIQFSPEESEDLRYEVPSWISQDDRWKYQLGCLLRSTLTGVADYTTNHRKVKAGNPGYRPLRSNWLKRRYGLFNGRTAFGPAWKPISSWMGSLLNRLLSWPGFPNVDIEVDLPESFDDALLCKALKNRAASLLESYGKSSSLPVLSIKVPKLLGNKGSTSTEKQLRTLRVCVAQTVLPRFSDFTSAGIKLDVPHYRRTHRAHSSAVVAGVQRMLQVRTTHNEAKGIELLVLPELSIHLADVDTVLKPFARQNRCIVCAGIVFHDLQDSDLGLVNLAVWLIPVQRPNAGLDVEIIFQGKQHLTPPEIAGNVQPFRPAQWILDLMDPADLRRRLWSMTSSICYDATDIALAADLRHISDLFVVPALNKDVGTYDNMAAALHYHMFQHVVVANSGEFGGSSGHAPFDDRHARTIFHTHGSEQVAISFFEIDFDLYKSAGSKLKHPPANFKGRKD